jgi:hypothetical protein
LRKEAELVVARAAVPVAPMLVARVPLVLRLLIRARPHLAP